MVTVFLIILFVICFLARAHIDISYSLMCVFVIIVGSIKDSNSSIFVWSCTATYLYLLYNLIRQNPLDYHSPYTFIFFLAIIWIIVSSAYNKTGIGSAIRTSLSIISPMLWGFFSINSLKSINRWFQGIFIVLIVNFLTLYDPLEFFSFIPTGMGKINAGINRVQGINYIHIVGLLSGFFLFTFLLLRRKELKYLHNSGRHLFINSHFINPFILILVFLFIVLLLIRTFPRGSILGIFIGLLFYPSGFNYKISNKFVRICTVLLQILILIWLTSAFLDSSLGRTISSAFDLGIERERLEGNRLEKSTIAIDYLLKGHGWFGLGTEASYLKGIDPPHQLPISYALYFGIPLGLFILFIFLKGIISSFKFMIISYLKTNEPGIIVACWWYIAILALMITVSFTNGAAALGYGFQWFILGGILSFNPDILVENYE